MNRITYAFYTSKLYTRLLRLSGRVPAGGYLGHSMNLEDAQACVRPGWARLVALCFDACLRSGVVILQIKEKYGTLRFYVGAAPPVVMELIDMCESASATICERCGKRGHLVTLHGWVSAYCPSCEEYERAEWLKKRAPAWEEDADAIRD